MPFSKLQEDFLRPAPFAAFRVFVAAHGTALILCMLYPVLAYMAQYSDERALSSMAQNSQNFSHNIAETFGWYVFYSLPAFLIGLGLYLSEVFYAKKGFRQLSYLVTLAVMTVTLYLDTELPITEHFALYGTGALYVALLFIAADFYSKRFAATR